MKPPESAWELLLYVSAGIFLASWVVLIVDKAARSVKKMLE